MDSRVAKEWATSEIEEARSFITSLNDNCNNNNNNNDDKDEMSTKHNSIMENLLKLFPWKTLQEVTGLYVELIVEKRMMQSQEKSGGASDMHDVDPKSTLVSDNFGISEGEEAMLDAEDLLFDYPLEEMEIGMETQEAPVAAVEENEVEVEMETHEVQVVVEKEVEMAKNRAVHRPIVPQKGMSWTTEEHSLFLQGLRVFGRGKWKCISKHFVTTRTPVQISSHAQKYFQKMEKNAAVAAKRQRCSVVDEAGNPSMKNAAAAERQRFSVVDEAGNQAMKNAAAAERQSCSVVDEAGNRRDLCMRNVEFAARAFAFAGVNYDPCLEALDLPPSPSFLEDLAKIWAPLLYCPQASQAWGEQVMFSAPAAPMEGAGSSVAAGHGASLPQPPLLHRPRASRAWGEQLMVSAPAAAAAAAPMEGAGSFVAAGHGASLPQPPLLYCPQASQAWGEQVMVSPAATAPMEGVGNSVAAGHGASLPQHWTGSMY